MKAIAFNGPPRVGKDTIANRIHEFYDLHITPTYRASLAKPLRLHVWNLLFDTPFDQATYERIKDDPIHTLGMTFREAMIHYSEEYIKPTYGIGSLAQSQLLRLGTSIDLPGILLISDSGFQPETDVLVDGFGPDNFLMVQLTRDGKDWGNDSRGYVTAPLTLQVHHDEGKTDAAVRYILTHCADTLGWDI